MTRCMMVNSHGMVKVAVIVVHTGLYFMLYCVK